MVNWGGDPGAGRLELFAPPRKPGPPPGVAPAKDRARGRVIQLRRQGLSTYEISARLAAEQTPLNRTSVGEILAEEGFGRLLRGPAPAESSSPATAGRDTRLPRGQVIDLGAWPRQLESTRAGLLLVLPDLVALDLAGLVRRAGYPATRVVPAVSWLLSLLALKLPRTRRGAHGEGLLPRPPRWLFGWAGNSAQEAGADQLLLPALPRPPAQLPGRPRPEDDLGGAGHQRAGHLRPVLPRGHAPGADT